MGESLKGEEGMEETLLQITIDVFSPLPRKSQSFGSSVNQTHTSYYVALVRIPWEWILQISADITHVRVKHSPP